MLLKLKNIGKIYDSNKIFTIALRNINLELDFNEFVTIEGESGSGKSTLLNIIGANDTYEEGEMFFNDLETSHYGEKEWEIYREKNISTIFQDFNIIENLTVQENIELALLKIEDKNKRRKRAIELIERVGLYDQKNRRASKLSGGEKQRTVIARALAKDSPIILADEPTGNLDVKSSKEIAALLKEVSKDKLVIVVTHNPEFFKQYATRRIFIYDGEVKEDRIIIPPKNNLSTGICNDCEVTKRMKLKTVFHIGALNYKSRPKFSMMLTFALFVCSITMLIILSLFNQSLIRPTKNTVDDVGVVGKVIVSSDKENITFEELDELAYKTKAGYFMLDRNISEFTIEIPKTGELLNSYNIFCLYSPYDYNLKQGEAILRIPTSMAIDANNIKDNILKAGIGINNIIVDKTYIEDEIRLYFGYDDLVNYGLKIKSLYSNIVIGTDTATVYTFEINESLSPGEINLINSKYYAVDGKTVVLEAKPEKSYKIINSSETRDDTSGMVVEMNKDDYLYLFEKSSKVSQSVLYFSSDSLANNSIKELPSGYIGMKSTTLVYSEGPMDIFTNNTIWYLMLVVISTMFSILICAIFMRTVKIYSSDFAVYKTLGISRDVSSKSLYMQMFFVFIPTLILLPVVSIILSLIPGSNFRIISIGNYLFIEALMLLIVEIVAIGFNKSINNQSIRMSLRRGFK